MVFKIIMSMMSRLSINVEREIYSHQTISAWLRLDSKEFRRILTLDGELISTEKDEFFYSEMMHILNGGATKNKKSQS